MREIVRLAQFPSCIGCWRSAVRSREEGYVSGMREIVRVAQFPTCIGCWWSAVRSRQQAMCLGWGKLCESHNFPHALVVDGRLLGADSRLCVWDEGNCAVAQIPSCIGCWWSAVRSRAAGYVSGMREIVRVAQFPTCIGCWWSAVRSRAAGYVSGMREVVRVAQFPSSQTHTLLLCS